MVWIEVILKFLYDLCLYLTFNIYAWIVVVQTMFIRWLPDERSTDTYLIQYLFKCLIWLHDDDVIFDENYRFLLFLFFIL